MTQNLEDYQGMESIENDSQADDPLERALERAIGRLPGPELRARMRWLATHHPDPVADALRVDLAAAGLVPTAGMSEPSTVERIREWRDENRPTLGPDAVGAPALAGAWRKIDVLLTELDRVAPAIDHPERLSAAGVGDAVLAYAATFDHLRNPRADQLDVHRATGERLYAVLASIGLEDVAIDMGLTAPADGDAGARTT